MSNAIPSVFSAKMSVDEAGIVMTPSSSSTSRAMTTLLFSGRVTASPAFGTPYSTEVGQGNMEKNHVSTDLLSSAS